MAMTSLQFIEWSVLIGLILRFDHVIECTILIRQPIGNITVSYCNIFKKVIPQNAYFDDVENSNDLELQLLDQNRKAIPGNAKYVQLNSAERTLYVVPVYLASSSTDKSTPDGNIILKFILRAINAAKTYEDDYFFVEISGLVPTRNYGISFKTEINQPGISDMENLYHFIETLYLYLYPPSGGPSQNQNQIQIYWYTRFDGTGGTKNTMELSYQNCTTQNEKCDLIEIRNAEAAYDLFNDTYTVPPRLDTLMKSSSFNIETISVQSIEPCKKGLPPQINFKYFQGATADAVLIQLVSVGKVIESYPGMFTYNFPNDTFYLPEVVEDIRIELQQLVEGQFLTVPSSNWAYITRVSSATGQYTLYIVLNDIAYTSVRNVDGSIKYKALGLTPTNAAAGLDLVLKISLQAPISYYVVTFTFTSFVRQSTTNIKVLNMRFFMSSLIIALGESYRKLIFLKSFTVTTATASASGTAIWGLKVDPNCDFDLIVATQKIMFVSENSKVVSDTFKQSLSSAFTLVTIQETFSGPCKLEPPIKVNSIPAQNYDYCGIYKYRIPENTFYDNQDGSTRNLSLRLLNNDNTNILASSWINFSSQQQTITAILPKEAEANLQKSYIFKLVAKDRSNQETICDVNVNIIGVPKDVTYRVTVRGAYSSSQNANPAHLIAERVGAWFKDGGKQFQLISQGVTSNNEQYASFTNCSWRVDPCDALKVDAFKKSIFPDGNTVSSDFIEIFHPEFQNVVISQTLTGACANNKEPKLDVEWGPLSVSSCSLFKQRVPESTFSDLEQGNTRNLKCSLTGSPALIGLPPWVRFNTEMQELTMLAYTNLTTVTSTYLSSLSAEDIEGKAISQTLVTNIATYTEEPTHTVEMTIKLTSSLNNFIDMYEKLRERIKFYFGDDSNTVEYIFMTQYPSETYTVHWTNCTVSRLVCEQEKLDLIERKLLTSAGIINPSFINALKGDFTFGKVSFITSGICAKSKENPKVLNLIPNQNISYCSYMRYQIPENTFHDVLDGGTRQLTLSLRNQDGSAIPNNNWLVFDETQQTVSAILQSANPLTQRSYVFTLTATTKRGKSNFTFLNVNIAGSPLEEKTYMRVVIATNTETSTKATEVFITLMDKLQTVYLLPVSVITLYQASFVLSTPNYVIGKFMNCDVECAKQSLNEIEQLLSGYDTTGFQPEFQVPSVEVRTGISCIATPPVLIQPPNPFTVSRCTQFVQKLSNEIFQDSNGAENLNYVITTVNGNSAHDWIATEGMNIVGLITNDVLKQRSTNNEFNLTLRAVNQHDLWAETWVIMTVSGDLPQLFYKYDMVIKDKLSLTSTLPIDFQRKSEVAKQLNAFFKQDATNIVSYVRNSGNEFSIQWSVCPLPNRCTQVGATEYSNVIFEGQQIAETFKQVFLPNYNLESIKENASPDCSTLNPPRESRNPLAITTVYCGGLDYVIPADMFTDQEDGGTRKLTLYFEVKRGEDVSLVYPWLKFHQSEQRLQGMPTYEQARQLNTANTQFLLTARDSSGLETTITANIKFTLPQQPKYYFAFIMSAFEVTNIPLLFTFMNKIASYMGDASRSNIGFTSTKATQIDYFNCSIPYSPCDFYQLTQIKNRFSDSNGIPNTQLRNSMRSEFEVASVTGNKEAPCGGPNRPNVNVTPPVVTIEMCGYTAYQIPVYTFYDFEDGNTRNLDLAVNVKSGASFSMSNYVQYVSTTQRIDIVPKAQLLSTYGRDYAFSLKATDKSGLSIDTELTVKIQGPYSLLTECQIQVTLQTLSTSHTSRTSVETMLFVIQRLMSYFQIEQHEIGIIDFEYKSSSQFYFSWSYCSALYQQSSYQSNSASLSVDYVGLQTKILQRLYHADRKTIHTNFMSAFQSDFSVVSVVRLFTGRCTNLPPIVSPGTEITIIIGYGGYGYHFYKNEYFYDFEDGWAYNLYLTMLSSTFQALLIDSWINVDVTSHNIYAVVIDTVRFSSTSTYVFYLQATDTQGLYARIKVTVTKDSTIYLFPPFSITYLLQYNGQAGLVYANQSSYIVNSITTYFTSITQSNFVLVRWYSQVIGYGHYRTMTWTVANHNCQSQVLSKVKEIIQNGLDALAPSLSGMFTIRRLYYQTTCAPQPPEPPSPPTVLPTLNITYCSVFVYNLPVTLFYDDLNGEADKLKLDLLDANGNAVSRSSWLQLNTATMEVYAIAIKSVMTVQSSYSFTIQATNSGGKSNTVDLNANIKDEPFTSDCKMTMQFKYKYETETLVDLDIIRRFVSMITEYYQDKTVMIKLISFTQIQSSYEIVWSNCSFQFQSKQQALFGLTETDRSALTLIFSQIVTSSNEVVAKFRTFMQTYFEIITIQVSYNCIEEPPVPTQKSLKVYAKFCELFIDNIAPTLFEDKQDGNTRKLILTLTDLQGRPLSINNWVQIDEQQNVYGVLTETVKENAIDSEYRYLLVATDSSGRSANVTYTIVVGSPRRHYEAYFQSGFINRFGNLDKSAFMLYRIVEKLSQYLDPQDKLGNIYVKKFIYPSTLLWTHCSLEPCKATDVAIIKNKMTTDTGVVIAEFTKALEPEVTPATTRLSITKKCAETNITIIPNPPFPNETIPNCGYFKYEIPASLFTDIFGRTARYFPMDLFYTDGSTIPATSWIRFNQTYQYVYAIPILSELTRTLYFTLQTTHPTSGNTNSIETTFTIQNYNELSKITSKLCYITFHLTVTYNPGFDDVTLLRFFMETLSGYLNVQSNTIQIYSYSRLNGYPFKFVVTWSSCTLTTLFQASNYADAYYSQFAQVINSFMTLANGKYTMMQEIVNYFKANSLFQITQIVINQNCSKPVNPPPKPKGPLEFNAGCGLQTFKIPDDTFEPKASQLSLTLRNMDGSQLPIDTWLILIAVEQKINVLINNATILKARVYKFKLFAEDSEQQVSETTVTINMPEPLVPIVMEIQLFLSFKEVYPYNIYPEIEIINVFNKYMLEEQRVNNASFYVTNYLPAGPNAALIKITNCLACRQKLELVISELSLTQNLNKIKEMLIPSGITLITLFPELLNPCSIVYAPVMEINDTVPYCEPWVLDLRIAERPRVTAYTVELTDKDGEPLPLDSWIWLVDYTLEGYPPVDFWEGTRKQWNYLYTIKNDTRILSQPRNLTIYLDAGARPKELVDFKIRLSHDGPRPQNTMDNFYISEVMNALKKLIGTGAGLHFQSFEVLKNDPFTFEVRWQNCSLPITCIGSDVDTVNSILYSAGILSQYKIQEYFNATYRIEEFDGKCKNEPPKPSSSSLNLTIPVCGLYAYKLDKNIATDDGGNIDTMTVTLLQDDGAALPIESWIRYNVVTQELYAFPTEQIIAGSDRYNFKLSFQDVKGGITTLPVYIKILDNQKVYYEMTITFSSQMPANTPYLDVQVKMLDLISMFTKDRTALAEYRVSTFSYVGDLFYMKYGDCSVRENICKKESDNLKSIEEKLKNTDDTLTARFSDFIEASFTGRKMTTVISSYKIDETPINISNIDVVVLSCCQATCVNIKNVFYDAEQENLKYTLKFKGEVVSQKYWVQVVENRLCVYPWSNVTVGLYEFTLEAMDNCTSAASTGVTVDIRCRYDKPFGYKWTVTNNNLVVDTSYPDVYYVSQIREKMVSYFKKKLGQTYEENKIQVISYQLKNNDNKFTFGECGITYKPCNQTAVSIIANCLFVDDKKPHPELLETFNDVMMINQVDSQRQYPCGNTPGGPECSKTKLIINATRCSKLTFPLPDICSDAEDGKMQNLRLKLTTLSLTTLPLSSWIQYNTTSREIYGYPMYDGTNITRRYDYTLEVQDSDGNKTLVSVCVYLRGRSANIDYRLTLTGQLQETQLQPSVNHRMCMTDRLKIFFDDLSINNIAFTRSASNLRNIRFNWSFCDQRDFPCDCMMVKKTQDLLQNMDRFKSIISDCVRGTIVSYELYGNCEKTEEPRLVNGISDITVTVGQIYEVVLPNNQFVDKEDGTNRNMTIIVRDANNQELTDIDWMTVYDNKICGVMDYSDYTEKGYTKETQLSYTIVAIDMCGKQSYDQFTVKFVENFPDLNYRVYIRFRLPYSVFQGNCSAIDELLESIADYAEVPKSDILIHQFSNYNDTLNSNSTVNASYFVWGVRKFTDENCDHEEFETFREKFIKDDKGNELFKQTMRNSDMEVEDIWDSFDQQCTTWPWWILILILLLLLLFLLLWCLWCCIPRCCPTCWARFCPGCLPCCSKGGLCSSASDDVDKATPLIGPDTPTSTPIPQPQPQNSPFHSSHSSHDGKGTTGNKEIDSHSHSSSGIESMSSHSSTKLPSVLPLPPVFPPGKGSHGGSSHNGEWKDSSHHHDHIDGGGKDQTDFQFHTESWTDKRPGYVYQTYKHHRRRSLDDDYNNRYDNYYHDHRRNGYGRNANRTIQYINGEDNRGYSNYAYHHRPSNNNYYSYESRPNHHGRYYYDDYRHVDKSGLRRVNDDKYKAGKRVRVKQPVAVRVRRSELNEYMKSQGRDGKIVLNSTDIDRLMQRNPKLSIHRVNNDHHRRGKYRMIRSDSSLSDALVDRKLIRTDIQSGGHSRSYSTSSLSDIIAINEHGKEVIITPRNVTFQLDGARTYDDGWYNSSSSYDAGRYVIRNADDGYRSGSRKRYILKDHSTTGDSTSDYVHNRSRSYDASKRISGGTRKVYELKSTGHTRNRYVNRGFDDSSV